MKALPGRSSDRNNLLFFRHRWLVSLRHWLILQVKVFILNLFWHLSVVRHSGRVATILSACLNWAPETASWSLLRGVLLAGVFWLLLDCSGRSRIAGGCRGALLFVLTAQVVLLFEFWDYPFFYVAEVSMLKACKLYKFLGPYRLNIAMLSASGSNGACNKVMISIDKFMVLHTEKWKEINILLQQLYSFCVCLQWH